jgi:hypothetical protein
MAMPRGRWPRAPSTGGPLQALQHGRFFGTPFSLPDWFFQVLFGFLYLILFLHTSHTVFQITLLLRILF